MAKKKRKSSSAMTAASARKKSSRTRATKANNNNDSEQHQQSSSSSPPYKLLMILSPAKTLNLERDSDDLPVPWTQPLDELSEKRTAVVSAVKTHAASASTLGALLKTSAKITATAQSYWKDMSRDGTASSSAPTTSTKPAITTFDGFAYSGLNVRDSIADNAVRLQYLQDHLRIVDPLYGWLRPMDAIEAYRLEMASRGVFKDSKLKLEDHWRPAIAECLRREASEASSSSPAGVVVVVNLASDEYAAAVRHPCTVKVVFRHGGRTIAVHAKRARGLMVRYASLHAIETIDDLKGFDSEGYSYRPEASTYDSETSLRDLLDRRDSREEASVGSKKKTKPKKDDPPTLVFDRPGTWKKPA